MNNDEENLNDWFDKVSEEQTVYEYHEYANIFPMLSKNDLEILAKDIEQQGLLNKIVLFENKIIDGRNRYEACKLVNVKPVFTTLQLDTKPLEYVISTNLKRRHLNESQRAMIAANLANMESGRRTDLFKFDEPSANLHEVSREEAAKLLNVGIRSVANAIYVKENAPEEIESVNNGTKTVSAVVKQTKKKKQINNRKESVKDIQKNSNLHLGDCVDILKTLETHSVDCVVMDLPYAINYKDTRESFNPEFEDDPEVIIPMLKECFKELKRVCKPNAHIYCFFAMSEYITFYNLLYDVFKEDIERIPIIWEKNNHTMCDFSKRYALKYEPIFFINNKERILNNPVSPNILQYNIPTNKLHKTQKPIELIEYLIKNSTVEGEVVLDPFMGSGTTPLAANNLKRNYIGIEKNKDIFKIAIERINNK